MKFAMEKEFAHRRSTDVEEEMETLKKAQEEVVFENKQLSDHLTQHKQVIQELKENLQNVNLSNARLLYTNRVLRNTSLNERQKEKIAEAISNAGSVAEAKVICETLQNTVETKPKRANRSQSLSEVIGNKRSSVIRATRKESTTSDPMQDRMKRLAGIK
jgi:predicted nuclease with TOPRIM domain